MSFDFQLALCVATCAAAVFHRRANILIFASNHMLVLVAFQNLTLRGQPAAYHYLPPELFARPMMDDAASVMAVPTVLLLIASVVPLSPPVRTEPLPKIPPLILWVVGGYFVFMFFSSRTVFETVYASSDQTLYGASAGGGIYVLAWAVVAFDLRRRVDAGELSSWRALALALALIFLLDFLKGSTGIATGITITIGFMVFLPGLLGEGRAAGTPKLDRRAMLRAAAAGATLLVSVALVVMFVRSARSYIATRGFSDAATGAVERLTSLTDADSEEGLESAANGTQGAAHITMCIALYDAGHSREWRSIWGPVEYTVKPSVLIRPLGLERSREAAWELGDYFIHGGGINTFGEFYWNGGYFCLIVMSAVLIGFLLLVDVRARSSWGWLALACAIAPGLVQGYGYGFAQVFRGIANGVIFLFPLVAYLRWVEERNRRGGLSVKGLRASSRSRPPSVAVQSASQGS